MTIHIPRPRLLLALLALLAFAALAYTAVANDGRGDSQLTAVPVGDQPELPQISNEELQNARAALAADSTFTSLTTGRDWSIKSTLPNTWNGKKVGVGLVVELSSPIDSSGPWKQLRCRGTVIEVFAFPYSGVSLLGSVFDQGGTHLIGLTPLPSETLRFDDAAVAVQPTLRPCPKGFEDESN
jgi:hypothetical protein